MSLQSQEQDAQWVYRHQFREGGHHAFHSHYMDPRSFYLFIYFFFFLFFLFFQIFLKKLRVLLLPRKSQLSMWTLPAPDDLVASKGYSLYKIRQSGHLLPHLYLTMSKGWPFKLQSFSSHWTSQMVTQTKKTWPIWWYVNVSCLADIPWDRAFISYLIPSPLGQLQDMCI